MEGRSQTLWGISPFQILFQDIASPRIPSTTSPSPYSSFQSPVHTRHQSRQCLHISQQINSVEHNPCRELSNALSGPPSPSPSPCLPPTQQHIQLQPASHSFAHWFMSFLVLRSPSAGLVLTAVKSLQPSACRDVRGSQRSTTHVFCIRGGSNLIEYSPIRSMYKPSEHSEIWWAPLQVFFFFFFFFVTRSPKQGTGFPIHFHEMSFQSNCWSQYNIDSMSPYHMITLII